MTNNYFIMVYQTFIEMCLGGVMAVILGCDEFLFPFQIFKRRVKNRLGITSLE